MAWSRALEMWLLDGEARCLDHVNRDGLCFGSKDLMP